MRKALKILVLVWRLGGENGLVALYLISTGYLILAFLMPKAFPYLPLQRAALVVFVAVNTVFIVRAVAETLIDAVIDTLEWLYYDAPLLPRLLRAGRSAWRRREVAVEAPYLWSYRLLLKIERFSMEHPRCENLMLGGYGAASAFFLWGAIYAIATNRYPPYRPALIACGYIFFAGILAFLFFMLVALLNAVLEGFYRLRACGFFDAVRFAASVLIGVSRELIHNRLYATGADSSAFAEGPGAFVGMEQSDDDVYEPHPLSLTVLPPLK